MKYKQSIYMSNGDTSHIIAKNISVIFSKEELKMLHEYNILTAIPDDPSIQVNEHAFTIMHPLYDGINNIWVRVCQRGEYISTAFGYYTNTNYHGKMTENGQETHGNIKDFDFLLYDYPIRPNICNDIHKYDLHHPTNEEIVLLVAWMHRCIYRCKVIIRMPLLHWRLQNQLIPINPSKYHYDFNALFTL